MDCLLCRHSVYRIFFAVGNWLSAGRLPGLWSGSRNLWPSPSPYRAFYVPSREKNEFIWLDALSSSASWLLTSSDKSTEEVSVIKSKWRNSCRWWLSILGAIILTQNSAVCGCLDTRTNTPVMSNTLSPWTTTSCGDDAAEMRSRPLICPFTNHSSRCATESAAKEQKRAKRNRSIVWYSLP